MIGGVWSRDVPESCNESSRGRVTRVSRDAGESTGGGAGVTRGSRDILRSSRELAEGSGAVTCFVEMLVKKLDKLIRPTISAEFPKF